MEKILSFDSGHQNYRYRVISNYLNVLKFLEDSRGSPECIRVVQQQKRSNVSECNTESWILEIVDWSEVLITDSITWRYKTVVVFEIVRCFEKDQLSQREFLVGNDWRSFSRSRRSKVAGEIIEPRVG